MVLLSGRLTHPKWATLVPPVQSGAGLKGEFDSNASDQGCPLSVLPKDLQGLLVSGSEIKGVDTLRIADAIQDYHSEMIEIRGRERGLHLPG